MTTPTITHTETEIAEALADGQNSFMTTHMFWDCSCDTGYIKPAAMLMCEDCGNFRDESPDSRINEIRRAGIHLPWADEPYVSTLEYYRGPSTQESASVL